MMAGRLIVNPLLETAVDAEPALLQCRLAEEGYVFVRGLLNPGLIGEACDLAVGCLEEAGLASGADRPIWSGRVPRENELASDGPLVSARTIRASVRKLAELRIRGDWRCGSATARTEVEAHDRMGCCVRDPLAVIDGV